MGWATVFDVICASVFVSIYFIFCGNKLFKEKISKKLLTIFIFMFLTLFISVNYLVVDKVVKTATLYLVIVIVYKILFNKPMLQCVISSFVAYIGTAIGEVLFIAVISILSLLKIIPDMANLGGNAFANLIIVLFSSLFIILVYKPVNKILSKIKEHNKITLLVTFSLLLIAMCVLFYKIYYHDYEFDTYLIFNLILVLALSYIAIIVIKQHYDKTKLSDDYERYVEYSKQSEKLVDQYSISQHENKNELIIIKSMVHKNNKELLEYLDEIITSKDNIDNAWIRFLRYLPFGGLKGIIHNKISEMKEAGINVTIDISKSIGSSKLKDLTIKQNNQLSKIIGVFLDNAREESILSQNKEVCICAYMNDDTIVFEISNTCVNEVNLSKIYDTGNTSKGKGRGYGLTLVKSIINENKIFENEVKIIDQYFVQVLKINI